MGIDAKAARAAWSNEEREAYIVSSGILAPEGEDAVLNFLADAIVVAPLPAPWAMHRSRKGEYFFVNMRTGIASWSHPLEPCLRELAGVCRRCLGLPLEAREALLSGLHGGWEEAARGEYLQWYSVEDENGQTYYCHQETGESMWEHPAKALLPEHYMRIMSAELLRDVRYVARISSRPSASAVASLTSTGRQRRAKRRADLSAGCIAQCSEAYFIGDSESDSDQELSAHLCIDIPEDCCGGGDEQLSCRSSQCTESFYIGESDESDDEPWSHHIDAADDDSV